MTPDDDFQSRPRLSALLLWLVPCVVLLDSLWALCFGHWWPEGDIEHGLLGLFALWLLTGVAIGLPGLRRRLGAHWREILLLTIICVIGWTTLEVGSHVVESRFHPHNPFHTRGPDIHYTRHTNTTDTPGIYGDSVFSTGPNSIRAVAPPRADQTTRVLCIGGSTTECVYLDDTETWPTLLERNVSAALGTQKLWVGNVGISGFYTRDHLQFLEDSPLLNGVTVLVVQPGINDMWRYLAKEENYTNMARFDAEPTAGVVDTAPAPTPYFPWWTQSRVIQLFHTLRADPPPPEAQEGIGGLEYRIRREKRAKAELVGDLPDIQPGLRDYTTRIRTMIGLGRTRGIAVVFTTQPVVWRDDLPADVAALCWFGWLEDGRYLRLGALREAMDAYNATLLKVCEEEGVPCVDLSSMNGRPEYYYDDCHFTEAGAEEVATQIAPTLAALLEK